MQWGPTVYFGASVHHQISLPAGLYICDHLRENAVEHLDLIFELWASLAMTSKCERSRENNNDDNMPAWNLSHINGDHDKRTQETTTHGFDKHSNKRCEIYIGRAILLHQNLLELLDQKECSTEVICSTISLKTKPHLSELSTFWTWRWRENMQFRVDCCVWFYDLHVNPWT